MRPGLQHAVWRHRATGSTAPIARAVLAALPCIFQDGILAVAIVDHA
jgi:hypothetical protein